MAVLWLDVDAGGWRWATVAGWVVGARWPAGETLATPADSERETPPRAGLRTQMAWTRSCAGRQSRRDLQSRRARGSWRRADIRGLTQLIAGP